MKKFRLFIIAVICLFVVGCGEKKVVKTCTIENDQSINGYKSVITFTISATGNNVVELKQKEVIESEKKDIIDFYKNDFETTYKSYSKNYGGYTYHIDVKDNQLIVDATINYKKF
ncbi:MAG: DUF1307 domain-containing protein, partial [Bacilli bacterium]|nr:DUF1307 domain-containing protein [Bacilli bacterium]